MMKRNTPNLRIISWFLTIVMIMPFAATIAEAAMVNFLSPLPGQTNSGRYVEVAVSFNTQSDLAITKLELWIDGKLYSKKIISKPESRGVCSFQWDTAGYANGSHFLLVKMFAGNREIASISGSGNVGASNADLIPPMVKITNLKSGVTLSGVQSLKLSAVDNSGEYPLVSLLVDQKLKLLKNTPPYTYNLDTTGYDDGKHEIQAYAFDAEGNKSDVVTFEVVFANGKVAAASAVETDLVQKNSSTVAKATSPAANAIVPKAVVSKEDTAARTTESVSTEALSGNATTIAAIAPSKEVKSEVAPVSEAPKLVAAAPAVKEAVVEPVKPQAVVVKPVEASPVAVAPATPVNEEPVVMAKLETPKLPDARVSETYKNVTASRAPAKIRSEQPLVMAISTVSAPPVPTYVKPVAPKVVKAAPVKVVKPVQVAKVAPSPVKEAVVVSVAPKKAVQTPVAVVKTAKSPVISVQTPKTAAKPAAQAPVQRKNIAKIKVDQKLRASQMMASDQPLKIVETTLPAPKIAKIHNAAPVKMAMAPKSEKIVTRQSVVVQPTKAKYDVTATELPKSGKVKVRDLVKSMNGVVLWDSEKRTVTAYVKNMKLELRIGKGLVKVNGKQMKVNLVPYISKGRTIIDVRLYDKACMVAGQKQPVALAKPKK